MPNINIGVNAMLSYEVEIVAEITDKELIKGMNEGKYYTSLVYTGFDAGKQAIVDLDGNTVAYLVETHNIDCIFELLED